MQNDTLLLETVLLNSFIREDSWVYVRIGNRYMRKKGRDVQEGDLVLVLKEGIDKGLEDVERVLRKSARYEVARTTLLEDNKESMEIAVFRKLLLQGLARPVTPDLDQRIMMEGVDFASEEYVRFVDKILEYVTGVGADAVNVWLRPRAGKPHSTLAPRDWENFSRLIPLNDEFHEIAGSFGKDTGYHVSYEIYTGLRRVIMHYIARWKGEGIGEVKARSDGTVRGKYAKEIELVVKHFLQEVDEKRAVAYVTGIKRVPREKREGGPRVKPDPHLTKGVVTQELDLPGLEVNQLRDEQYILENVLIDALNRYVLATYGEEPEDLDESMVLMGTLALYVISKMTQVAPMERSAFKNNRHAMMAAGIDRGQIKRSLEHGYRAFLNDLRTGAVDDVLGVPSNTFAHVLDYVNEYRSALPKLYFDQKRIGLESKLAQAKLISDLPRPERRKEERRLHKMQRKDQSLQQYLQRTYGLRPVTKHFLLPIYGERLGLARGDMEPHEASTEELQAAKRNYEGSGERFYSRQDVELVLDRLGIPEAIKILNPKTFV